MNNKAEDTKNKEIDKILADYSTSDDPNKLTILRNRLIQNNKSTEQKARVDELRRLYPLKVNEIHAEINDRLAELKKEAN